MNKYRIGNIFVFNWDRKHSSNLCGWEFMIKKGNRIMITAINESGYTFIVLDSINTYSDTISEEDLNDLFTLES